MSSTDIGRAGFRRGIKSPSVYGPEEVKKNNE